MKADNVLDCVGLYCPVPLAMMAKRLKEIKIGQVIEIVADDPGLKEDLPNWCKTAGHEFLGLQEDKGQIHGFVKKTHE